MKLLRVAALLPLLLACTLLPGQEFSGGFRAGLNFITFQGDAEMDDAGTTLEEFKRTTGFHVGATFAYEITDLFGLKADLMYSQKGGEVRYTGPSYFYLYADANDTQGTRITGSLESERDVLNSYIDIPLVAYYRLGPLELEGGVTAAFLVNSRASGSATYSNNITVDERRLPDVISFNYDYNYFDDRIGGAAVVEVSETRLSTGIFPPSVIDAYYNAGDNTPLYRRFDFGLVGGAAFFLNNGLYLGLRYQLGLTDATRGENDQRLTRTVGSTEREYNTDDKDYNRVIQASVGFRF
ncbi:porin family protein [Lewinella sp. JB7]|uniref:porin family protein n=1 Tax=Lewinella sp. JB7 TaxID=2962887 RepID=UPI0020C9D188|nr:porin family protein [Lewinella sp. JB7]MCP9237246.1 PorT family protein [Lewinella sp. JB7]